VYTVALFTSEIAAFNRFWRFRVFWSNLLMLLVLHLLGLVIVLSMWSAPFGVPKLVWSSALLAEVLVLAIVLWKQMERSKRQRSED